jgi:DNA-binding CsgD family transcriptional regulator
MLRPVSSGIRPAERRRSRLALTLAEREVISRGVTAHQSARSIAELLGRSPSTVSREMSRNGGYNRYRATLADESAWARSRRPKCCKLAINSRLRRSVAGKLRLTADEERRHSPDPTMTQTDIRITELMMRLTALERERAAIIAEIETLRSAPNEEPAANKVIPPEKVSDLVDRNSTIESKMALFRRLFRGRPDIFPIRWENRKTGRSGYAPACANEWQRGICEKPKVKCSACPNQAFLAVDDVSMERHLRGTDANGFPFVMGVYPPARLKRWGSAPIVWWTLHPRKL